MVATESLCGGGPQRAFQAFCKHGHRIVGRQTENDDALARVANGLDGFVCFGRAGRLGRCAKLYTARHLLPESDSAVAPLTWVVRKGCVEHGWLCLCHPFSGGLALLRIICDACQDGANFLSGKTSGITSHKATVRPTAK